MKSTLAGIVALAIAILCGSGDVLAFELRKMSLKELIASSDLIFVGTMVADGGSDPGVDIYGSAIVRVD